MKRTLALLVVLLTLAPAAAEACTCFRATPFQETARFAPVVVHARVLEYDRASPIPLSMLIEVIHPLRDSRPGERIRVWGDNGMLCRPYVSQFPRGSEWILVLGSNSFKEKPAQGDTREFSLSGCGVFWLAVRNGKVSGEMRKIGKSVEMDLQGFLRRYADG